ncbi:hypothetical protein FISHEDRAFT_76391 [Fistulina hepatica ATCC 64428]|uniref:Uncharacterized protein n=1 Tax=Fistulina hepatica ATCC 64428 TaxID=1128425 RepID=A0A0D7A576_9AGAR|nr:hypothetical protein FISHEDRAFT_76391 [Fistulina hepatica ATCC 64428]
MPYKILSHEHTTLIGTYDQDTIPALIDAAPVLHVSFLPILHVSFLPAHDDADPFPVTIPMIGCIGAFSLTPGAPAPAPAIYLHGHVSARLLKLNSPNGIHVCIAATVVFKCAHPVTSDAEKLWALGERITDNALPGRWRQTRIPPTSADLQSTGVLRVEIVSKARGGQASGPEAEEQGTPRAGVDGCGADVGAL